MRRSQYFTINKYLCQSLFPGRGTGPGRDFVTPGGDNHGINAGEHMRRCHDAAENRDTAVPLPRGGHLRLAGGDEIHDRAKS
jgi:hypothetical protein